MDVALREFVRTRANGLCEYCRLPDTAQHLPFHVEHIVARQHGGDDDVENLAWACDRCNAFKGPNLAGIDPQTGQIVELFHPRRSSWKEHFLLDEAVIVGRSPIGRTTVRLLQMNARRRVELRIELIENGEFD